MVSKDKNTETLLARVPDGASEHIVPRVEFLQALVQKVEAHSTAITALEKRIELLEQETHASVIKGGAHDE